MKEPVIVVLAAGMGSRYGGLKQIDPVGLCGEAILDYSLYDAYRAGFRTAVIIIKEAIRKDFMDTVGKRLEKCPLEIRYAYQEKEKMLPAGFEGPEGRVKPWGTSHAILCAAEAIGDAPFGVINADDYYGISAFKVLYDFLKNMQSESAYAMVGYELGNTVTDNGSVSRGVCKTDGNGMLASITECSAIEKYAGGIRHTADGGATWEDLPASTTVSMNMWGFSPAFIRSVAEGFPAFLKEKVPGNPLKAEYFLPTSVENQLKKKEATVQVLHSPDKWFGVTYAEDKPQVVASIKALHEEGKYPKEGLWK